MEERILVYNGTNTRSVLPVLMNPGIDPESSVSKIRDSYAEYYLSRPPPEEISTWRSLAKLLGGAIGQYPTLIDCPIFILERAMIQR